MPTEWICLRVPVQDLTSSPDKYLTLQKYRDYDKTKEMNSAVEEERRGKAYSKIINSASTYAQVARPTNPWYSI